MTSRTKIIKDRNIGEIPKSITSLVVIESEADALILRLDIALACKDYAFGLLERDDAKLLRESLNNIREIEDFAGQLARLLNTCCPSALEWMKDRGPNALSPEVTLKLPHIQELMALLPASGADVGLFGTDLGLAVLLSTLSRLASLTASSIQDFVGTERSDAIATGGRQSLNVLSAPHPSWRFVVSLLVLYGQRRNHEFGSKISDNKEFSAFVVAVLDWMFDTPINLERSFVKPVLQCAGRLRTLNKRLKELSNGDHIVEEHGRSKNSKVLQSQIDKISAQIDVEEQLLHYGPPPRALRKPRVSRYRVRPETNLSKIHVVECSQILRAEVMIKK